jgi:oxaloacetate decarboxylase alpha subunit
VRLIDTTFRDGSQSLWASGMRAGMMEPVAAAMDEAGFAVIEVPVSGTRFKKLVRDLREDPWAMTRMLGSRMPRTPKTSMASGGIHPFEAQPPHEVVELFYSLTVEMGALQRIWLTSNTFGQKENVYPWMLPFFRRLGVEIALALSYTISPRHTDEYYAEETRRLLPFEPSAIVLKDQGGLLTVDRARTLLPVIMENAGGLPVELHSHCTTGLAPLVYLEAVKLGVGTLSTGIPPLANGAAQPSVFNMASNLRLLGYSTSVDEERLRPVSERLTAIAEEEGLPIGAPLEYDHAQYVHQIPGGVISNLRHQLTQLGIGDRLGDVIEESVRVREDLGYPIMITPHSQFVVTQAMLNVTTGERYKHVVDEVVLFAQGIYGVDSGYTWMDQELKDRLLGSERARELARGRSQEAPTLKEMRARLGGPGVSDEEFLLRYIMKGEEEIRTMRAAGPPRQYLGTRMPVLTLLRELEKHRRVRYLAVEDGRGSLVLQATTAP